MVPAEGKYIFFRNFSLLAVFFSAKFVQPIDTIVESVVYVSAVFFFSLFGRSRAAGSPKKSQQLCGAELPRAKHTTRINRPPLVGTQNDNCCIFIFQRV